MQFHPPVIARASSHYPRFCLWTLGFDLVFDLILWCLGVETFNLLSWWMCLWKPPRHVCLQETGPGKRPLPSGKMPQKSRPGRAELPSQYCLIQFIINWAHLTELTEDAAAPGVACTFPSKEIHWSRSSCCRKPGFWLCNWRIKLPWKGSAGIIRSQALSWAARAVLSLRNLLKNLKLV